MLRNTDGLLPGRRVNDKQSFLRLQKLFERFEFVEQRLVDFLAASRVENTDVSCLLILPFECRRRHTLNVLLLWIWNKRRNVNLLSERGKLLDRSRSLQIAGNECGRAILLFQQARQFRGRSGFARTIQPDNQNSPGFTHIKRRAIAAEEPS